MVGIPKILNTKRDLHNLHEMALNNLIDRKEWIARLKELKAEDIFRLPILEKGDGYFIIPKTERELPKIYAIEPMLIPETEEIRKENEVYKITGEVPAEDFIELSGGHQEAEKLGLTVEEIISMIEELM